MDKDLNVMVSIIIPVYQAKDTLRECVLSCLSQKDVMNSELEIILVDDGSTDGSSEICDELAAGEGNGRIKVKHIKNGGVSHARNIGMEMATGRFVAFVDSDDTVSYGFIEDMLKYLDEATLLLDDTDKYAGVQKISGFQYIESSILNSDTHVWGKLFDRESFIQNHITFDERLTIGEDLLFLIDFALSQGKEHSIKCVSNGGYHYTDNAKGAMKRAFKESYIDQITCWEMAEERLLPVAGNISPYAFVNLAVSQIMTALLVVGKVAMQSEDQRDNDLSNLAVSRAGEQINHGLKTRGAYAGLSFGYKIKVNIFKISPKLYIKLYARHKHVD